MASSSRREHLPSDGIVETLRREFLKGVKEGWSLYWSPFTIPYKALRRFLKRRR